MDVCCECCVLSGRGLCDELITRPEESYRLWCVVVCDLETSRMRRPWPALGRSATKKIAVKMYLNRWYQHFVRTSWLFRIEDKEVGSSETFVSGYQPTWYHIRKDENHKNQHRGNIQIVFHHTVLSHLLAPTHTLVSCSGQLYLCTYYCPIWVHGDATRIRDFNQNVWSTETAWQS